MSVQQGTSKLNLPFKSLSGKCKNTTGQVVWNETIKNVLQVCSSQSRRLTVLCHPDKVHGRLNTDLARILAWRDSCHYQDSSQRYSQLGSSVCMGLFFLLASHNWYKPHLRVTDLNILLSDCCNCVPHYCTRNPLEVQKYICCCLLSVCTRAAYGLLLTPRPYAQLYK